MKALKILFIIGLLFASILARAQSTQTVRGQIVDKDSKYPIIGANIVILDTDPIIGTATDADGYYRMENVPLGRLSIKITFIGYKEIVRNDLLLVAGKELELNIEMEEDLQALGDVVVKASQKNQTITDIASVSVRTFDTEETSRYAGSRNDPARMASNFAGVSGANDARNDIIIRGNSPSGVLWRLEGIDIPSPNHFSSFGSTGGPVSILNNNVLSKSDFMTAAFPSEYGNALAGVFDLQFRDGNSEKREYLGQVGFNGFELGAEGPLAKNSRASYLINYRYSTLGVFKALGVDFGTGAAVPEYQDLTFKLNIPTKNAGRFTIFGIGGFSNIELLGSELDLEKENPDDLYGNENEDSYVNSQTGIIGLSHTYFFNENTFYKLSLAVSHQKEDIQVDSITENDRTDINRFRSINLQQNKYIAHLKVNHKINAKNKLLFGVISDVYDTQFADSALFGSGWFTVKDGQGTSVLAQAYANWQHKFSPLLTMNVGLHSQYFSLSESSAIEPRFNLRYQLDENQSINFGYGLHNQLQPIPTYYTKTRLANGQTANLNENMDFTQSHHFALGYDYNFTSNMRLKAEVYYQALNNAPVQRFSSSFSMLNAGSDFGTPDESNLINGGEGRNYGIELTLEKFFSKQYYFLVTSSIFNSEYKGSDDVWRNTAFNGRYVFNALAGKEFTVGKKGHTLVFDAKFTWAGGRYYTPIDLQASAMQGEEVLLDNQAFSEQFDDYLRLDLKVSYRVNGKKITQEWAVDVQNITNRDNVFTRSYNSRTNTINTEYQLGLFIVPQYKILF